MPETNIIQDGVDRFRETVGTLEERLQRVQKELHSRRVKLEKRFASQRKEIEKRFESGRKDFDKRTQKLRSEIEKNPAVKRLETLRKNVTSKLEQGVSDALGALQIASKSDVQRIDRKISQLTKKLKEMDRPKRGNSASQSA